MENIKKIIKENKYTAIGIVAFTFIAIVCGVLYNLMFAGSGKPLYGNRLDGISKVKITDDEMNTIISKLKEEEIVDKASYNIKGRILNVHITVKDDTKLDDSKKLTSIIVSDIKEEQKKFYDIQVFLNINGENVDGYPTIGYLNKNSSNFKYTSATYEKDDNKDKE